MPPPGRSLGSLERLSQVVQAVTMAGHEAIIIGPGGETSLDDLMVTGLERNRFNRMRYWESSYDTLRKLAYENLIFGKLSIALAGRIPIPGLTRTLSSVIERRSIDILQIELDGIALLVQKNLRDIEVPIVVDYEGILAEELASLGRLDYSSPFFRMLQHRLSKLAENTQGFIVMTEAMKEYISRNYQVPRSRVGMFGMTVEQCVDAIRPRYEIPTVVYAGQVALDKRSDLFIDSIPFIVTRHPNVQFLVTARGEMIGKLVDVAKKCNARVRPFWFDSRNQMIDVISRCHVGVITLAANLSYKLNPASKFFTYASAGIPVVANDIGGWISIVRDEGVGILSNNSAPGMADAVSSLLDNPQTSLRYGRRILNLARGALSVESSSRGLNRFYESVISNRFQPELSSK